MVNVTSFSITDNPPVFDRPTYETQITEEDDRNLPKRVLQVTFTSFLSPFLIPLFCFAEHRSSVCLFPNKLD